MKAIRPNSKADRAEVFAPPAAQPLAASANRAHLESDRAQLQPSPEKGPWLGLGAALTAALGAGLCCAGPLLYLLFGISAASAGLLAWPIWLQWPLAAVALFFWALVFYRLYFSARPVCITGIHRYLRPIFWLISCIIGVLLSYPYWVGWLLVP